MATLGDRLDFVIGKPVGGSLEEYFGIHTVGDLLRYFPRKYSDGMTVRAEGEVFDLEDGEHVTFVDVITETKAGEMKPVQQEPASAPTEVPAGHARPSPAPGDGDVLQRRLDARQTRARHPNPAVGRGRLLQRHDAAEASGLPGAGSPTGKEIGTKSLKTIA